MDHIHSWYSVEVHQLTDMVNSVHYILNIIDGELLSDEKVAGDNFSKNQIH